MYSNSRGRSKSLKLSFFCLNFHPDVNILEKHMLKQTADSCVKMELNATKTSSSALLNCGNQRGLSEKLLLKPRPNGPQTERVPRSSVLDRLQSFLPQMAQANEKLKKEMEESPAEHFDIENVDEAERVIQMDVALVELSGSDGSSEEETEDSSSDSEDSQSDSDEEREVTEKNLKLPGQNKRKANIQVLKETGK